MNNNEKNQGIKDENSETIGDTELLNPADSKHQNDSSLEALVDDEQSIAAQHLREKFGREATRQEIDEWLSAHTESY